MKSSTQKLVLTASQFIDDKLRLYSAHSNVRGIPFIGDGFKESHRKALDGMMRRGENADKDTVERIAAAAASCFVGDTPVLMGDGTFSTIEELVDLHNTGIDIYVMCRNENSQFVSVKISNAFETKTTTELISLDFGDGEIICTPDHLFLTECSGWVKASDLDDHEVVSYLSREDSLV